MSDPREAVLAFLAGLPLTIRSMVEADVLLLLTDRDREDYRTYHEEGFAERFASGNSDHDTSRRTIILIGGVDHAMARDMTESATGWAAVAASKPDLTAQAMAARQAMAGAHFAKAVQTWRGLRASTLSDASLRRWHQSRLGPVQL